MQRIEELHPNPPQSLMTDTQNDDELERCTLSGRREILFQLRSLIRQSERISVSFDEGRQSFLTVLIEVSEKQDELYFDIGGSEETNRAFLKSERCQFAGVVGGIRIQFTGRFPRITTLGGERVFAMALPKTLLRLQRRDAFRLRLPTSKPYFCRIHRGSPEEIALPVYDISVIGLGIQVAEKPALEPLEKLDNCRIDLRESGMLTVNLEICYVMATESRTNKSIWHIGCKFIKLSPLNEMLIQRFMARIETERRALSTR